MNESPELRDRFVDLGLPSTDALLDQLDDLERRIHRKVFSNLVAFLICDMSIIGAVVLLGMIWFSAGFVSPFLLPAGLVAAVCGFFSFRAKSSLYALIQDRASVRRRIDARLAEVSEDDA